MDIHDQELDIDHALTQAIVHIGEKQNNLLYSFGRIFQYTDEPKFFQYYAQLSKYPSRKNGDHGTASGFSFFSRKIAVLKCLLEALERHALYYYDKRLLVFTTASKLNKPHIDITSVVGFSQTQRETYKNLTLHPSGPFSWVLGVKLQTMEDAYIPAQLVYLSYRRKADESLIRLPISTGAACGTAYCAVIYRGLCEVIERDAFMITYLNKLPAKRIPLEKSSNTRVRQILRVADNYKLQILVYDISTDLNIYSFLSVIYDRSGLAASLSTGLKSGLAPIETLLGSIQEAFHPRTWLRRQRDNFKGKMKDLTKPYELSSRGVLWALPENIKHLRFLLYSNKVSINIDNYENKSGKTMQQNLQKTLNELHDKDYDAYAVDITPHLKNLKKTPFKVVMTVVPKLQPLYLDERYPYFGGDRLYSVPVKLRYFNTPKSEKSLHRFPHPFL